MANVGFLPILVLEVLPAVTLVVGVLVVEEVLGVLVLEVVLGVLPSENYNIN